ncbi:MAG: hypothetical protein F6J92_33915, partial [Symploca sp. SIO1A3]|nr:hypothetical protein [Symploca sp. SIO1A3]
QTSDRIYKASLSRQLSVDLSPDVEETTFKDTAKSWFIKTADLGTTMINYFNIVTENSPNF